MRRLLWLPFLAFAAIAVPQAAPKAPKLVFVFLTRGDVKAPADQAEREAMQKAHIGNFQKQFAAKKLIAAGPVQDPTQVRRGIVVLTVDDEKEVPTLFTEDPFVRNGIMKIDAGLWHADRTAIHEEKAEPAGLEENRIVVLTAEKALSDDETRTFAGHVNEAVKKGVGGWVGKPGARAVFLFQGKEDASLTTLFEAEPSVKAGKLKLEIFPLWMSKGALTER